MPFVDVSAPMWVAGRHADLDGCGIGAGIAVVAAMTTQREKHMAQDPTAKPTLATLLLRALDEDMPPTSTDEPDRFVAEEDDGYTG